VLIIWWLAAVAEAVLHTGQVVAQVDLGQELAHK
jgi:hypothetical protein